MTPTCPLCGSVLKRPLAFVCEECGKIGPAKRKSKRFCDDRCRRAFNYRKGQRP